MRIDRRILSHFEWFMLVVSIVICAIGISTVYSATHSNPNDGWSPLAVKQLVSFGLGLILLTVAVVIDYRRIERYSMIVYLAALSAVIAVPVVGRVAGGSRRWINIGPLSLQPSEFMKVALVVILAAYFARVTERRTTWRDLFVPLAYAGLPAALILAQPDLGSASVLVMIVCSMLLLGGVPLRRLALLGSPGLVMAPLLWGHLKPYQQQRVLMFINPDTDPLGAGYHIIQSKIAVGSGMIWGKGFTMGTQNHLNFLPEQHTDFIFSVFAEEWGFAGGVLVMTLYLGLVLRGIVVASKAQDRFGVLLALGMTAIVFWQVLVNVGMVTGLMPVVGIPLPFFSYGGSSMMSLLAAMGFVMSVAMRRFVLSR